MLLLLIFGYLLTFGAKILTLFGSTSWLERIKAPTVSESQQSWGLVVLYGIIFGLVLNSVNQAFKDRATHLYVYKLPDHKKTLLLDIAAEAVVIKLKAPN